MQYSLLGITEHKLSKFQVSEADSILMTVINDGCNLMEKRYGFWLCKSLLAPYVGVKVPMGWREEDISVFWSYKDTFNAVDSWISFHSEVAREDRMRWTCGNDLKGLKEKQENNRSVTSQVISRYTQSSLPCIRSFGGYVCPHSERGRMPPSVQGLHISHQTRWSVDVDFEQGVEKEWR